GRIWRWEDGRVPRSALAAAALPSIEPVQPDRRRARSPRSARQDDLATAGEPGRLATARLLRPEPRPAERGDRCVEAGSEAQPRVGCAPSVDPASGHQLSPEVTRRLMAAATDWP